MDRVKSTATWVITAGVTVIAAFGVARGVIDARPAASSTTASSRAIPTTTTLAPTRVVPTGAHAVTVSSPSGTRQGDDSSSVGGTGGDN